MRILISMFCLNLLLAFATASSAQVSEVHIGVSGLTCSACTKSVENKIRKLSFVNDVEMNLEHTNGVIKFKPGEKVEFDKIAQAVYDAGFSVSSLQATIQVIPEISADNCFVFSGDTFVLLNDNEFKMNGKEMTIKFIGEKFVDKKAFKLWKSKLKGSCTHSTSKRYYIIQ